MPIDLSTETPVPLADAGPHLHRPDLHVATLWRWASTGLRGVRLETYTVGRYRMTTLEACRRFLARTNRGAGQLGRAGDDAPSPSRVTVRDRSARDEEDRRALLAAGVQVARDPRLSTPDAARGLPRRYAVQGRTKN